MEQLDLYIEEAKKQEVSQNTELSLIAELNQKTLTPVQEQEPVQQEPVQQEPVQEEPKKECCKNRGKKAGMVQVLVTPPAMTHKEESFNAQNWLLALIAGLLLLILIIK